MAQLNHKGPNESGSKTGRKLGLCKTKPGDKIHHQIGLGLGLAKHSAIRCTGKGKRNLANKQS